METLLCYGDSNTFGYDPADRGWYRYPKEVRWTGILAGTGRYKVFNEGSNGRQIPHDPGSLSLMDGILAVHQDADRLLIMLGTNDIFEMWPASADRVGQRMRRVFEEVPGLAHFRTGGRETILIAPPRVYADEDLYGPFINRASEGMADALRDVAEDYGARFLDASAWGIGTAYDGVHFSAAGHRTFADRLMDCLEEGRKE